MSLRHFFWVKKLAKPSFQERRLCLWLFFWSVSGNCIVLDFDGIDGRYNLPDSTICIVEKGIDTDVASYTTMEIWGFVTADVGGVVKEIVLPLVVDNGVMVGPTIDWVKNNTLIGVWT